MNIVVCDYCREQRRELVEAVDIIPAFTLIRSREKVGELGVCESHKNQIVPAETIVSVNGKRPTRRESKEVIAVSKTQHRKGTGRKDYTPKPKNQKARLNEVSADGVTLLNTRQIAERIQRPMKSMGYVLRDSKPVGIDHANGHGLFVYSVDELARAGVLLSV